MQFVAPRYAGLVKMYVLPIHAGADLVTKLLAIYGCSLFLLSSGAMAVAQSTDPGDLPSVTAPTISPAPHPRPVPDRGPIDRVPTLPRDPDGED